jgi:aminoglycoside phosphotransferase family enzyme
MEVMTPESMHQYELEERSLIINRIRSSRYTLNELLSAMKTMPLSLDKHIHQLRKELAEFHKDNKFLKCKSMGAIVERNLLQLESI